MKEPCEATSAGTERGLCTDALGDPECGDLSGPSLLLPVANRAPSLASLGQRLRMWRTRPLASSAEMNDPQCRAVRRVLRKELHVAEIGMAAKLASIKPQTKAFNACAQ
ncbi:hypothetical protein AAFF_G00394470 [Aldrovandia affinis]|uniref:Uncharacterized protein n=1 Tax=Aldrovandia affinis TaxID=143900 RepID=A0AAD7WKZ8_9TELE|nr:hypothetical protein AAFF_G00394470 [Aldrovandia affinis]